LGLDEIAKKQQEASRYEAFYEAYKGLRRQFFGRFQEMANEVANLQVFRDVSLEWSSGSDDHARISFKSTGYSIWITAFDHSFGFADGGGFWAEASADHYYISDQRDGKYTYRQVVNKPALPLKILLSDDLAKKYLGESFKGTRRFPAQGDYRFLWRGEEDEGRFKKVLVTLLSGGRPQSDFEMVFQKDKRSGCFIATAVFGPESREVSILREFRDERLLHSSLGRHFVHAYTLVSPSVAVVISKIPLLQKSTRYVLRELVDWALRQKLDT
jgi:hypothetical protein